MKQTFINLTTHVITEVTTGIVIPMSGNIARIDKNVETAIIHNGAPIYATKFGVLNGLPEPVEGTIYIVSAMALNGVPAGRTDVVSTGFVKRDKDGKPLGCVGFQQQ